MSTTNDTVHGRIDRARTDLTLTQITIFLVLLTAVGFVLLFVQEPLVHDSLHNFRHSIGVTCH